MPRHPAVAPGYLNPDLNPGAWSTDERFYQDDLFPVQPKQKGEKGRDRAGKMLANRLMRSANPKAVELGHTLYMCTAGDRCLSGACIKCGTARGRAFAVQVGTMFPLNNMALLTVIPSEPEFQPEDLADLNIDHHRNAFSNALAEVGLSDLPIAAGLDLNWNTNWSSDGKDFWTPHWHAIISADHRQEVAERLRINYRNTKFVDPAVQVKLIRKTPVRAIYYCVKVDFTLRHFHDNAGSKPIYKEKIVPGYPCFEPLMLALDRIGLDRRILVQS